MSAAHLELDGLTRTHAVKGRTLTAVDDVSLAVGRGETLGLVGESGCGKSSLARLIMQLDRPTAGSVRLGGVDLAALPRRALAAERRRFQIVFQDPYAALNPRMTAGAIIAEPLRNYGFGDRAAIAGRVLALAGQVGLSAYHLARYPHELSGGQCQRVGIARAIAVEPELIVADEPVSALDVSIQAQVINLILRLQRAMGLTLVFISHDLSVVAHVADRVAVMYLGRLVEVAPSAALFAAPLHPYTQALLAAVPRPHRAGRGRKAMIRGELPSPLDPPSGCRFRTRCPRATAVCAELAPPLEDAGGGHHVACHHAGAAEARQDTHVGAGL